MSKTALISGNSGQDGSFPSQFFLLKGSNVCGVSRDTEGLSFSVTDASDASKALKWKPEQNLHEAFKKMIMESLD